MVYAESEDILIASIIYFVVMVLPILLLTIMLPCLHKYSKKDTYTNKEYAFYPLRHRR